MAPRSDARSSRHGPAMGTLGAEGDAPMPTEAEENASLVRRFLTDVVADGDRDGLEAFVAEGISYHNLAVDSSSDLAEMDSLGRGVLAAADVDIDVVQTVAEDDMVAVRATISGTSGGLPFDLGASGKDFEIAHVSFYRIEDGRIAESWSLHDRLGLAEQLEVRTSQRGSPAERDER